jgi:hypothetical protein
MSTAHELLKSEVIDLRYRIAAEASRADTAAADMRERAAALVEQLASEMACGPEAVYVGDYRYVAAKIRSLPLEAPSDDK